MARIFISYRRADSQAWADRIYPVLVQAFGKDNVFKDVDSITLSRNFRAAIERAVINSDVVLILIGRQWVTITDDAGHKRLDNPDDFVRLEAEMALRHDKMVIPVTVDGARMPATTELPSTLQDVPVLNGANVRGDPDFEHDMGRLIRNIQELTGAVSATAPTETIAKARIGDAAAAMEAEDYEKAINLLKAEQAHNPTGRLARIVSNMLSEAERDLAQQTYLTEAEVEYRPIAEMIQHARTRMAGCAELTDFHQQYPDYDPDGLTAICAEASRTVTPAQTVVDTPAQSHEESPPTVNVASAWKRNLSIVMGVVGLLVIGGLVLSRLGGSPQSNLATATATQFIPTDSSTLPGFTPITRNADWTLVEQDFDGVTMVLVPAGCFDMGSNDGEDDEKPVNKQCFDAPFWIDRYEVKQSDFVRSGGVKAYPNVSTGDNRPVERITWFEARKFCEDNRQARLPSEREWEYAARGPDNLVYPWGDTWDENKAVWNGNSNNQTAEVGSRPAGVSWVGALDMSGNVWEWVSSAYDGYPYDAADGREDLTRTGVSRVVRGGSWNYTGTDLRGAARYGFIANDEYGNFGFRCARSS